MIFVDFETNLEDVKRTPDLKKLTGANAMISEKAMPPVNSKFIKKHTDSGAILYRIVNTSELIDITVENLLASLGKMHEIGCAFWQCVILVDSSHSLMDYDTCVDKVDAWVEHGGASMFTFGYTAMYYLKKHEKRFLQDSESKTTFLIPNVGPRKELEVIKDWTFTLATLPGLGIKGARTVRKLINEKNLGDDLLTALIFLTDDTEYQKSEGQWREIRKRARDWLGLPDGFDMDLKFSGTNITNIKD